MLDIGQHRLGRPGAGVAEAAAAVGAVDQLVAGRELDAHGVHPEILLLLRRCRTPEAERVGAAVGAAGEAEGGYLGAIAVHGHGHGAQGLEAAVNPHPAAIGAVPAGIGDPFAVGVKQWIPTLQDLHRLVGGAADEDHHLEGVAVLVAACALAALVPEVVDVVLTGLGMDAADAEVREVDAGGVHALGLDILERRRPAGHGHRRDLLVGPARIAGRRRRLLDVDAAPWRRQNLYCAAQPVIERRELGEAMERAVEDRGLQRGAGEAEGAHRGGVAPAIVEACAVALDGEPAVHPDTRRLRMHDVLVREILELVHPVRELGHPGAEPLFRVVEDILEQRLDGLRPVADVELQQAVLDQRTGLSLGVDVGDALAPGAHVVLDQRHHRAVELALVEEPHRRHPQPLGVAVHRARVEAAGQRAAHIGPVAGAGVEGDEAAFVMDRADQLHVVAVDAAGIGVVEDVDVARLEFAHPLLHHPHRRLEGADVGCLIPVAVGDQPPFRRQQRAGMIVALADGRRIGEAGDHLAPLVAHASQRVAQHLEGDGV